MTISASIDAYGSIIRSSCMADYLELRAISGDPCRFADLSDQINDRWPQRGELFQMPNSWTSPYFDDERPIGDDNDAGELHEVAEGAVTCISERRAELGDDYPFHVEASRLILREGVDLNQSKYISLLAITSIHAYKVRPELHVDQIFEEVLAQSLAAFGLRAFNVGRLFRENRQNFEQTVQALSIQSGIVMDPNAAPRLRAANDNGVDFFGFLDWQDVRSGRWIMIGQATCGSSDTWKNKIAEPLSDPWSAITHETINPQAFLAVPHHVDTLHHEALGQRHRRAVVDRVRIVKAMHGLPAEQGDLVDTLLTTSVE